MWVGLGLQVYEQAVAPALGRLLQTAVGTPAMAAGGAPVSKLTVLAYGQTGSGKTYTMQVCSNSQLAMPIW